MTRSKITWPRILIVGVLFFIGGVLAAFLRDDGGELGRALAKIQNMTSEEEAKSILGHPRAGITIERLQQPAMFVEMDPIAAEDYPVKCTMWNFSYGGLAVVADRTGRIRARVVKEEHWNTRLRQWLREKTGL